MPFVKHSYTSWGQNVCNAAEHVDVATTHHLAAEQRFESCKSILEKAKSFVH